MTTHILDAIPVHDLTREHFESLITLRIEEDESIEFKQELVLASDSNKREFCKDVTAIANSFGGYLIFGVEEDGNSRAQALTGVRFESSDEEQLTQILTSGITPRIQSFELHKVAVSPDRYIVLIKIDRDGQLHQVKYGDNRFYKRVGKVTVVMEPADVATFFEGANGESRDDRLLNDRLQFEGAVRGGTFHHLSPNNAFTTIYAVPVNRPGRIGFNDPAVNFMKELVPIYCSGWDRQFRGESVITFGTLPGERGPYTVAELTQWGTIKAADSKLLEKERYFDARLPEGAQGYIPSIAFEREIILSVHRYLNFLMSIDVAAPWRVGLSLLNIRGYVMAVSPRLYTSRMYGRILAVDGIYVDFVEFANRREIETHEVVARKLKDAFDFIWREFNFPKSLNYDDDGNWSESRQ